MHNIDISPLNIEAFHWLPLSNAQATKDPNQDRRVIIKFVNCKLPKCLLQIKKAISSISYNHLNVTGRVFVNTSLCPYYQFLLGQGKLLVNKKKIHQVLRFMKLLTQRRFFISVTFLSSQRKLVKKSRLFYLFSVASIEIYLVGILPVC